MTLALAFDILAKDKASRELDNVGDAADESGRKLDKMSNVGKAAFAGLAGAAGITAIAIAKAFDDALDMGKAEDKLAAQLGLSPADAKAMGDMAGDIYTDAFGESLEEVNAALGATLRTFNDLDDAGLERATKHALNLAAVFDTDVPDAVKRAGVLVRTGLAKDADAAFDMIVTSMQRMTPELRDELGDATTEYSKFFADLGISGEEMLSLFLGADDVFELDKMGDAVKEFTIRATDMSTASQGAFEVIGLDAQKMAERLLAGGQTARFAFGDIVQGLLDIENPATRANTAIALFGTPLEDLGVAKIPTFLEGLQLMGFGLGNFAGKSDEAIGTMTDNAQTKVDEFKRTAQMGLVNWLADDLIPAIEGLVETYNEEGLGGVLDEIEEEYLTPLAKLVGEWVTETGIPKAKEWGAALGGAMLEGLWDAVQSIPNAPEILLDIFGADGPNPVKERTGRNARGTDHWSGGFTWVGEEGPELVNLPGGSQIVPSNTSLALMAGGGGGVGTAVLEGVGEAQLLELREQNRLLRALLGNGGSSMMGRREMAAAI